MEAEIVRRGDRYFILPLEASNGTCVNQTQIAFLEEVELQHGERIHVAGSSREGFWLEFTCEKDVLVSREGDKTE